MGLKIPPYVITRCSNTDPHFYGMLGPFLANRQVVDELGSPVWDDDDKDWLIAYTADEEVLGFVSIQPTKQRLAIRSLYVIPDARRQVVGSALIHRILALWPEATIKATATEASLELFHLFGFTDCGERGRFTLLERVPDVETVE
jgi:GNAT superfamily N-acetyltransferase